MGVKYSIADADGGIGSTGFEADLPGVRRSGGELFEQANGVRSARTYGPLRGCGDYNEVAEAVSRVLAAWDPALTQWQQSLQSLGMAARSSAAAIEGTDQQGSAAWTRVAQTRYGLR